MTGPQLLRQQMDVAVHHGLNVMRFWVPGVSPQFAMQLSPGVYNEAMLEGSFLSLEVPTMPMSWQSAYACMQHILQHACTRADNSAHHLLASADSSGSPNCQSRRLMELLH